MCSVFVVFDSAVFCTQSRHYPPSQMPVQRETVQEKGGTQEVTCAAVIQPADRTLPACLSKVPTQTLSTIFSVGLFADLAVCTRMRPSFEHDSTSLSFNHRKSTINHNVVT